MRRSAPASRGGHVQEAIEVDTDRRIEHGAQEFDRRCALQRLVQRVGGCEGVVDGVPVPELVGGVEAGHPEKGSVSDRAAQLLGSCARPDRLLQRFERRGRVVREYRIDERQFSVHSPREPAP